MKSLLILVVALAGCVYGDVSHLGYDYSAPATIVPQTQYLPPVIVKSESLPLSMYLPPAPVDAPKNTYIPPLPLPVPITKPHNDYLPPVIPQQTYIPPAPVQPVIPKSTYLPPIVQQAPINAYLPPTEEITPVKRIITPPAPRLEDLVPPQPPQRHYEDSEILTDDGYKTVRKSKY